MAGLWEEGPYLGAPGLVFPPLKGGQVATQPCAQAVEEDHVEWDAHQGIEDTEDLACLGPGCPVPISCRGGMCKCGKRRFRTPFSTDCSSTTSVGRRGSSPVLMNTLLILC